MLPTTSGTRPASSSEDSSDCANRPKTIKIDNNDETHNANLNATSTMQFTNSDECSDSEEE